MVYVGFSVVGFYFKVSPLLHGLDSYIKGVLSPLSRSYHLILIISGKVPRINMEVGLICSVIIDN